MGAYTHTNFAKYIYMTGIDITDAAGCNSLYGSAAEVEACLNQVGINKVVPSLGNSMWRYECENDAGNFAPEMRFNLRQAGANIRNCGPGTMPDADGTRCSWNWNFIGYVNTNPASSNTDPEGYFMRSNPKSFEVWDVDANNNVEAWGNPGSLTEDKTITVSLQNRDGTLANGSGQSTLTAVNNDLPSQYLGANSITNNAYTFVLQCANAGGNVRDVFPDCFQGEEIHLSAVVTYPQDYTGDWTDVMADPWLTQAIA